MEQKHAKDSEADDTMWSKQDQTSRGVGASVATNMKDALDHMRLYHNSYDSIGFKTFTLIWTWYGE